MNKNLAIGIVIICILATFSITYTIVNAVKEQEKLKINNEFADEISLLNSQLSSKDTQISSKDAQINTLTNKLNGIDYDNISELTRLSGTWERTDGDETFFYEKMIFGPNFFTNGSLFTKLPVGSPGSKNIGCYLDLTLTKPGKGLIIFTTPELYSQESLPSAYGYVFKDSNHLMVGSVRGSEWLNANYSRVS
jgi:hypothetical protein